MIKSIYGLLFVLFITLISYVLANFILIGAVAISIILGIIIGNSIAIKEKYSYGITYAEKTILAFAIALMGINLDFSILTSLGLKTIFIIIAGMIITIYSAILLGRYFKVNTKLALLLGIGNGVCGSSAISATAPIIKADKNLIGLSIAIVNLLGTLGIFIVPAIAIAIGLNEIDTGILIGNTLQAVGQVTAGGFSVSDTAGISATTVKMGRVLLLTPLILILIYQFNKQSTNEISSSPKVQVPLFIIFFIIFSLISSFSLVSEEVKSIISSISHFSLVLAMSAIGLKIHFNSIKSDGKIALKIATIVFVIQIIFTVGLLYII